MNEAISDLLLKMLIETDEINLRCAVWTPRLHLYSECTRDDARRRSGDERMRKTLIGKNKACHRVKDANIPPLILL